MAKVLDSYEFTQQRQGKYPWEVWFDGQIHQLSVFDNDFIVSTTSMKNAIKSAAKRLGVTKLNLEVSNSNTIVVQALEGPTVNHATNASVSIVPSAPIRTPHATIKPKAIASTRTRTATNKRSTTTSRRTSSGSGSK